MLHRVIIPGHIQDRIAKLHPLLKSQVRSALDLLSINPKAGKTLNDEFAGLRSYRVSRHRIIYFIRQELHEIHVVSFGHRSFIYKSPIDYHS